jgi:hypothetical protein
MTLRTTPESYTYEVTTTATEADPLTDEMREAMWQAATWLVRHHLVVLHIVDQRLSLVHFSGESQTKFEAICSHRFQRLTASNGLLQVTYCRQRAGWCFRQGH